MGGRGHGQVETLGVDGAESSAKAVVEVGAGPWGCWGATEGAGQGAAGRGGATGRGGADSRTPARRLLGQLQPVDGEAVGATTHAAALALAPHVTLGLAHVCRLDLVAAVALSSELQPGIQVTPGEGCGQAGVAAPMQTPGGQETQGGWEGSGAQDPQDHPLPSSPYTYPRGHTCPTDTHLIPFKHTHAPPSLGSLHPSTLVPLPSRAMR